MAPISTFIGREEEVARLRELVESCRIVTVVGPGGIGKTRLATEVTAGLGSFFPGGMRRCELAPIGPRDDIGVAVAADLGFASLDALVLGTGEEPCLLVLDNCEHVLAATGQLCEELLKRCPVVHLVATSREPLGIDGEHVLALGSLGLPVPSDPAEASRAPSVRLYFDRARAAGARAGAPGQLDAVAELCRRLDGIPLAIELAAARARTLTPAEILAHLDRRFDVLRRASPVGTARHACLRTAIDTSYGLLEPDEQSFFRALGAFAGPFDATLAHAVAGAEGEDPLHTIDLLSRLVDRSLVVAEPHAARLTRYRLLDSLRHYAREHAAAAGEAAELRARFVDAMIAAADRTVAEGIVRWTGAILATIRMHFANWTAAIEACLETDATAERALRLLIPMWGAVHQGRAGEMAALCDRIHGRWPEGDEPWRPEGAAVAASAYLVAGRPESAVALARDTLRRASATELARVVALRTLALEARHRGDLAAAAEGFRGARDAAIAAGMEPFELELGAFLASVESGVETGNDGLDAALATLDAIAARAAGDQDAVSHVWARLVGAQLLVTAGRPSEARAALAEAQRIQVDFEYPYGQNVGSRLHAVLATREHGWRASRDLWRAAVDRNAGSGDLGELGLTLRAGAVLAAEAGDPEAAAAFLEAVPAGAYVTVLGELFADAPAAPVVAASPGGSRGAVARLHRVRELLARSDDRGEDRPSATPAEGDGGPSDASEGRPETRARRAAAPPPAARASLRRAGDVWTIEFAGRTAQVRHLKGLEDLAILLARPTEDVHCLELTGAGALAQGGVPGLDERARREYQARIRELQLEIDEAHAAHDPPRAERVEAELDALIQQLSAAFGLSGRERPTASTAERARSAVTWRIRTAIKRLREVHPELGRHLGNAVRTGTWCRYQPESRIDWSVETR